MDEFKLQFKPRLIQGVSSKVPEGFGRKHYVAGFVQLRQVVHFSRVQWRTATDAKQYADKVVNKYQRMAIVAFQQWLENAEAGDAPTS